VQTKETKKTVSDDSLIPAAMECGIFHPAGDREIEDVKRPDEHMKGARDGGIASP
jgi:hypothetical protein